MPPPEPADDLDAFFSAAVGNDPDALREAAKNINAAEAPPSPDGAVQPAGAGRKTTRVRPKSRKASSSRPETRSSSRKEEARPGDGEGQFIAVEPSTDGLDDIFVLIPANIHQALPWWGWVSIGVTVAGIFLGVLILPRLAVRDMTARLAGGDDASAQSAMRHLVLAGDDAVDHLYSAAASDENEMTTRLRAVDALGLIAGPAADRALLRLELGATVDDKVRQGAMVARKQRAAGNG